MHAKKKMCFKRNPSDCIQSTIDFNSVPTGRGFHLQSRLKARQERPLLAGGLFSRLNAGLAEVDFEGQRAGLLALLRLLDGDGDDRAQVEGVDFVVGVVQELLITIDAQLDKTQNRRNMWGHQAGFTHTLTHTGLRLLMILMILDASE